MDELQQKAQNLSEEIKSEDNFILTLIDSIPPKAYFNQEMQDYLEEKKCNSTDSNLKALNIDTRMGTKGKHKRARLDPSQNQTVSQIMTLNNNNKNKGKMNSHPNHHPAKEIANIGDLQERLRARIELLQSARKCGPEGDKEAKLLRRKLSKMKKKKKGNVKKGLLNGVSVPEVEPRLQTSPEPCNKPVFNKNGKIVYSKFDFCESKTKNKKGGGSINLKKAFDKVKLDEKKMKELSKEDPEKAFDVANKQMWKKAIGKIEGVKIKDDRELLKKTIKKKEQIKKRSHKKWTERTEQVEKLQKQRQDKRKANIQDRKKQKVDKKMNRAKKKGRILPGF